MVTSNRNILGLGMARQIGQQSNRINRVSNQLAEAKELPHSWKMPREEGSRPGWSRRSGA